MNADLWKLNDVILATEEAPPLSIRISSKFDKSGIASTDIQRVFEEQLRSLKLMPQSQILIKVKSFGWFSRHVVSLEMKQE